MPLRNGIQGFALGDLKPEDESDARKFQYISLPSQCDLIDNVSLVKLEEAAMCCHLRDFKAASRIFKALPAEILWHPTTVYEQSQVYWLDWSLYECENVLQKGIAWGKDHRRDSAKSGIYTLLRMALGRVQAMTSGNLTEGREAMREVMRWLREVPIEDYTDVQTYCVCTYYHLLHFLGNVTMDFDKEFFQTIPAVPGLARGKRLKELRLFLQRQGRLLEARAVLDQELGQTPNGFDQQEACRSLIEACHGQNNSREPIWWIEGRTKVRLGQVLAAGRQVSASKDALQSARLALKVVRAAECENNTLLLVRLAELNAMRPEDALQSYDIFVQNSMVKKDNYILSFAFSRACKVALLHLENGRNTSNSRTFWRWYKEAEAISKKLGDIAYLCIFRLATGDIACEMEANYSATLKWHQTFEKDYPSFNLWRQKFAVRKSNIQLFNLSNMSGDVEEVLEEMEDIRADQDSFWMTTGFRTQAEVAVLPKRQDTDEASAPAAFQNENPEVNWLLEWSMEMPVEANTPWNRIGVQVESDATVPTSMVEVILCLWIKEEVQAGALSKQDVSDIFAFKATSDPGKSQKTQMLETDHETQYEEPKPTASIDKSECHDPVQASVSNSEFDMASLTPELLGRKLFGTYTTPTDERQWDKKFSILSDWLLRRSNRSAARRHFLLFQVQNHRLSYVVNAATSYSLRAKEAQRLISLFPNLNVKVREHISSNFAYWRSVVAGAKHVVYIRTSPDAKLDMNSLEVKEVISIYKQALLDNRQYGGPHIRDVYINMDMARVYFHAAAKLDPVATEGLLTVVAGAVQAFEKIRAGWRALTGWDRVEKLLSALEERRVLDIAPTVVTVVRQVPDTNREARDQLIWNMIQFAKSIGISWLMESNTIDRQAKAVEDTNDLLCAADEAASLQNTSDNSQGTARAQSDVSQTSHEGQSNTESQVQVTNPDKHIGDEEVPGLDTDQLLADLHAMNLSASDAVFVDWYNSSCILAESPKPIITTINGTNDGPRCTIANITWDAVDEIVNRFMELDSNDLQDSRSAALLDKLSPLVQPLSWTRPGQTLVFSPFGNLHRIPLHALKIDGEVVIRRNPIVYCSSLSALASAYRLRLHKDVNKHPSRTQSTDASQMEAKPSSVASKSTTVPVSLFGSPPTQDGQTALESVATQFRTKAHTASTFTSSSFTTALQSSGLKLLHFHGHADFRDHDYTDHCLLFSNRGRLTVRDIFDLPPPLHHHYNSGGFHATLLGCGSGMSKTVPTNDVLGLVPSLLYAGASSTISTLWNFSDGDAAAYSDVFYQAFLSREEGNAEDVEGKGEEKTTISTSPSSAEVGSSSSGTHLVVDLAKANQRAVSRIMQVRPALYHWAPFVLNGYWKMERPPCGLD